MYRNERAIGDLHFQNRKRYIHKSCESNSKVSTQGLVEEARIPKRLRIWPQ